MRGAGMPTVHEMYPLTMTIEKRRVSRGQVTAAKRGHSWSASLWAKVVRQGNALRSAGRWATRREPDALRSNIGIKLTCYTRREQRYLACESCWLGGLLGLARMQLMPFPLGVEKGASPKGKKYG